MTVVSNPTTDARIPKAATWMAAASLSRGNGTARQLLTSGSMTSLAAAQSRVTLLWAVLTSWVAVAYSLALACAGLPVSAAERMLAVEGFRLAERSDVLPP